jgi:hypothetical protein
METEYKTAAFWRQLAKETSDWGAESCYDYLRKNNIPPPEPSDSPLYDLAEMRRVVRQHVLTKVQEPPKPTIWHLLRRYFILTIILLLVTAQAFITALVWFQRYDKGFSDGYHSGTEQAYRIMREGGKIPEQKE